MNHARHMFGLFEQHWPKSPRPWMLLETYISADGPRTRIVNEKFETREFAEKRMHNLQIEYAQRISKEAL